MKKKYLLLFVSVSLFIFPGSSIWEGAATMSEVLPQTGLYMATNSFPLNSVVEVINLENGFTTHLIVHSGLESAGFLAFLSRDAINALGIAEGSLGRVRMNQVSDLLALSRFNDGRFLNPDNNHDLVMIPTEERPPVEQVTIDPNDIVDPIEQHPIAQPTNTEQPAVITQSPVVTQPPAVIAQPPVVTQPPEPTSPPALVTEAPPVAPPAVVASRSAFSAPTITNLQMGKFYVQIAAYSNIEAVNSEISRVDSNLPVAVMDAGTPQNPLYRVLIGPLTLGEAGAIIQRVRLTHNDAFVRIGE